MKVKVTGIKGNKMKKKELKGILKQEIESEASAWERRVNTKRSLASLEMPEDSYDELMERIREKKEQGAEPEKKSTNKIIPFCTGRKALITAVMVVVLVTGAGLGVHGARLYILNISNREQNNRVDIAMNTEDIFYVELTEEEAYEKIEEEIGILALRLTDKPKEMELKKVYIDAEMGEAIMEFYYNDCILSIYENKQSANASFQARSDGEIVGKTETFYLEKELEILKINKSDGDMAYQVQLEYGNAVYRLISDMEQEEFENILYGLIFKND